MNGSSWTQTLWARLADKRRVLLFRWWIGRKRGDKAVTVLEQLSLPSTARNQDTRLDEQLARWGPYLRKGSVAPLTVGRSLLALAKMVLLLVVLAFLVRFVPWREVPALVGYPLSERAQPSPPPPTDQDERSEVSTWDLRLREGDVVQVTADQRVTELEGQLYLEILTPDSEGSREIPLASFDGDSETVDDLMIRHFFREEAEPIHLVWRRQTGDSHWISEELYSLLGIGAVKSAPPTSTTPTAAIPESGWRGISDAGSIPLPDGSQLRSAPTTEAAVLLRTEDQGTFQLSGTASVVGESLWLGVVLGTSDGRLTQGWVGGQPSSASIIAAANEPVHTGQITLEGQRRLRESPGGRVVRALAKGETLVISGDARWADSFLWLQGQVARNDEMQEGWVGFSFEQKRPAEEP